MHPPVHVEGYAIVSEDGMLTNTEGVMPPLLRINTDQHFFERGLGGVDIVVHGRNSHERRPHWDTRRRMIVTRTIPSIAADSTIRWAIFWNPAGASFDQALAAFATPCGSVGVIGGTGIFEPFLGRYDVFYLSRVSDVRLPGGRPIFRDVPLHTLEAVLAAHGLNRPRR